MFLYLWCLKLNPLNLMDPQILNIEQEKDREKGKVGGRPAKLYEKKNKGDISFVGRTT